MYHHDARHTKNDWPGLCCYGHLRVRDRQQALQLHVLPDLLYARDPLVVPRGTPRDTRQQLLR